MFQHCETNCCFIMPPPRGEGHYKLHVRLSVACLDITRKQKGLESPKLAGWIAHHKSKQWTYLEVKRCQGHQADYAHTENAQYLPKGKAYELYTDGVRRSISPTSDMTSEVKGQGRMVRWCVSQVLADKLRTKRSRNTKIGRTVAYLTGNNVHQFQGKRAKVKVTRSTNAETRSASYLPKGKAHEIETWCINGARRR